MNEENEYPINEEVAEQIRYLRECLVKSKLVAHYCNPPCGECPPIGIPFVEYDDLPFETPGLRRVYKSDAPDR